MEEASWKQKSRICWLVGGDNNTKYFHSCANARRGYNAISALRIDGTLNSDRAAVKKGVVDYYTQLYTEDDWWRPQLDQIEFPRISDFEKTYLERIFTEDEILAAIKDLAQDKAPGPDGFPVFFFSHYWNVIKSDYLALFADFYNDSYFDWRINATFITLVPKQNQVEEMGDFWPISLLSSSYKVLAKAIASRLKVVMSKLVAENQTAYIKGRNIVNGILIANELVDSRLKASSPGVICKVDMEKAFDRISWKYLEYVLTRMGFDWKWRSWKYLEYVLSKPSPTISMFYLEVLIKMGGTRPCFIGEACPHPSPTRYGRMLLIDFVTIRTQCETCLKDGQF